MILATVKLKSDSPMAQGRAYSEPKLDRELNDAYERRTWRLKMHTDNPIVKRTEEVAAPTGNVVIPAFALKNCLSEAAKFMSVQIPGKGKSTYTKHFESGVLIVDAINTGVDAEKVEGMPLFVPASGIRGDGKRVWKTFPVVQQWEGIAQIYLTDEIITKSVLEQHLKGAGCFIGLGSLRVRNNGIFGRFSAEIADWQKV